MAKPTETRLSVPTATAANSSVSSSPRPSVSRIGTISRQVRTARNSQSVISSTLPISPCDRALRDGGEFLVGQRHLAGDADTGLAGLHEVAGSAITARIAAVAAPPGCSAP